MIEQVKNISKWIVNPFLNNFYSYDELTAPKEEIRLINSIFRRIPETKEKLENLKVSNKYVMYQPKARELNKQKER